MYSIYTLVDPRDDSVFYIGQSVDVYKRFVSHINCVDESNYKKNRIIWTLRSLNLMVKMEVVEQTENRELALEREAYWIAEHLANGCNLTNWIEEDSFDTEENNIPSQKELRYASLQKQKAFKLETVYRACQELINTDKKVSARNVEDITGIDKDTCNCLMNTLVKQNRLVR